MKCTDMHFHASEYIPHFEMDKVGVAQSVHCLTSVHHINDILRHECRRFSIKDQKL